MEQQDMMSYPDFFAAHEAASKLRLIAGEGVAVRVEPSRYGAGYVVRQFPVEFLIDVDYPTHVIKPAVNYG